jgi:hypothetical protein
VLASQTIQDLDKHSGYICDSVMTQIDGFEYITNYEKAQDFVSAVKSQDSELYSEAKEMLEDCKVGNESPEELISLMAHWILYTIVGDRAEELLNKAA